MGEASSVGGRWSSGEPPPFENREGWGSRSVGRAGMPVPPWKFVITSAAVLFRVVIDATAVSIQDCLAAPFLIAVEIAPAPRALVKRRRSPGWAAPFLSIFFGSIRPVTE